MKNDDQERLIADWERMQMIMRAAGRDPSYIRMRAIKDGVSPRTILEGFNRSNEILEELNLEEGELPPFDYFEALPPGAFDPRTFDQAILWVDIWRKPHRIAEMDATHLEAVIEFCRATVQSLCEIYHRTHNLQMPADESAWLESTTVMGALRSELAQRRP